MSSISQKLARFVSQLDYADLSKDQVLKIKHYFLDWLGSAYAGGAQQPVRMMLDVVDDLGGNPEATIIPTGARTMSLLAALANGASSHIVEMDDLHRESILHPAASIMPAVFASAEQVHASGRKLIAAIAAGYEVGIRVAVAAGPSHYWFWHTTATCGTFGAAAGSAKIFDLDEDRTVWALGSAGTQAAGLWEFLVESAMSKQLHPGKAAMNGLLSTLLARKGFTGARRILEGEKGFFRATSQNFDGEKCLAGLGEAFMFERNSLKYHASCGHTHSAIDAVLQATGTKTFKADMIKEVKVHIYRQALDLLGKVEPETPYLAKFNLPFCVATALRYGQAGLEDFNESRLKDDEILRLMAMINLTVDSELSDVYPARWPARIEIITSAGTRLKGKSDYPKGDPENPLTEEELINKFRGLTAGLLSPSETERIIGSVLELEKMPDTQSLLVPSAQTL